MSEKPSRNFPKRSKREMPQVAVRLTVDQISDLDRIAEESAGRQNRSDLIRAAVDEYLHRRKRT
jgi:metal-responsive CopG/Arc/MetJ family transcriptional regulator